MRVKIFVIYHDSINDNFYDPSMIDHLTFVNVTNKNIAIDRQYTSIKLTEFDSFIPLGKWYAESEVIYNIYKNPYLYSDADYIGFIHHDMDASSIKENILKQLVNNGGNDYVIFQPYNFKAVYKQKILMDENQPNTFSGAGKNCFDSIFDDYNTFYNETYNTKDFFNSTIGLCSAFMVKKQVFNEMMVFIESIINSNKLENFDTNHNYRIQGGLLERYYALWLLLKNKKSDVFAIPHSFVETNAKMSYYQRMLNKLKETLGNSR